MTASQIAASVHRVPLSAAAVALLGKRQANDVPLFKVSSADALRDALKANGGNGFTVHGFGTSMQEWILATTAYGSDLADMCIHVDKRDSVRKAYQRGDQFRAAPANSQRVVGLRRRLIGIMWVTRVTHICDARGSHIRRRRRRGIRQPIPMHPLAHLDAVERRLSAALMFHGFFPPGPRSGALPLPQ